ncbi:MAG: molybdate ABC transporter substrate-binding protein [Hyphomicrobiales bacterium]
MVFLRPVCALEPPAPFTVFAASSLTDVLESAISTYETDYPSGLVTLSVAGTGILARQIVAGAPANVFVSADREWIDYLADEGIIEAQAATLVARNRLVLVSRKDVKLVGTLDERLQALADRGRIAIGEPQAVPVGRYAKAALVALGQWDSLQPSLVPTDNVRVALALVSRGEVEGAIVYATDAELVPDLAIQAVFLPRLHPPIQYWAIAIGTKPWTAFDFVVKLRSRAFADVWAKHGFLAP